MTSLGSGSPRTLKESSLMESLAVSGISRSPTHHAFARQPTEGLRGAQAKQGTQEPVIDPTGPSRRLILAWRTQSRLELPVRLSPTPMDEWTISYLA